MERREGMETEKRMERREKEEKKEKKEKEKRSDWREKGKEGKDGRLMDKDIGKQRDRKKRESEIEKGRTDR